MQQLLLPRHTARKRTLTFIVAAVTFAAAATAAGPGLAPSALAATTTLCQSQTAPAGGGTYIVQNNEWGSSAAECITTDGSTDFTVANSSIANSTSGAPGGYPSIYQGCHWGNCSSGGLTTTPIQASNLTTGKVTTSWATTQPGGSNDYDVAYDIWFNQTSTTTGQPNCLELMVWLNHNGPVQPFGSQVASNVSIGGHSYNVWEGAQSTWNTVSYTMTTGTTSVSNLDIGQLAQDAINRGYMPSSCWLIDVEAGFELWQGGTGLATSSFSVNINGGGPPPGNTVTVTSPGNQSGTVGSPASLQVKASDSAPGQTLTYSASGLPPGLSINSSTGLISGTPTTAGTDNVSISARDGTGASGSASFTWTIAPVSGGGSCTATYTIINSWSGGFQGQVTVTAGSAALSNWTVGWTFPGDQEINQMWNATYSQSGKTVTASNMPYNGALAAGASTTFGFTGTYTSSDTPPTTLTCT